jgi:TPR repeat protein
VTALRLWHPLANQGDASAQFNLGLMYVKGQGVPLDYAEAVKWFRKAADQGRGRAQFYLGLIYDNDPGAPDHAEAVKWFRKAADQGIATAQFNLAVMYHDGQGVPQDYAEAMYWYRKAADQGDASAQCNLGVMYDNVVQLVGGAGQPDCGKKSRQRRTAHDPNADCRGGEAGARVEAEICRWAQRHPGWLNQEARSGDYDSSHESAHAGKQHCIYDDSDHSHAPLLTPR